jgi:hypothetical protein
MEIIYNNPYRIIGLLAGATAREQDRQIKRIMQFLAAEQEPEGDYSFPSLGKLDRTLEDVTDASSKLTLDHDKITAALFWFWNGNPIYDEDAFEALKSGDTEAAADIWRKLAYNSEDDYNEVTKRNASAFHNLSTLYLSVYGIDEDTLKLKLSFLESDFVYDFKEKTTDETYKVTIEELQLLFLNNLLKDDNVDASDFIEALSDIDFSAKSDFMKGFIQKPIEQIEQKIETAKNKRKVNKANGAKAGQELFDSTSNDLIQLTNIISTSDIKYTSIVDKVANEILQCSIDYFNDSKEKDSVADFAEISMKLARLAASIAVGNLIKDRIKDSINTLEEMKDKEITQAILFLQSVKDTYEKNKRDIKQQVKQIEETDINIRLGYKSINHAAVEENIKNSIDWEKVNELLLFEILSDNNLKKIKESNKTELKPIFLELMYWLKENSSRGTSVMSIINKYKKIPPKIPFKILSSDVTNTDNKPFYTKFVRYIGLSINIEATDEKTVTLYLKYIKPNGSLKRNSETSPTGYTRFETININSRTKSINISGWGNSDECTYDIGENTIEVYIEEYLIHSKKFVIDLAPSEKLDIELKKAEIKLAEIKKTQYFKSELETLNLGMSEIQEFQLFRSSSTKQMQISEQQRKIEDIHQKAMVEKERQIEQQNKIINKIKLDIQNAEY